MFPGRCPGLELVNAFGVVICSDGSFRIGRGALPMQWLASLFPPRVCYRKSLPGGPRYNGIGIEPLQHLDGQRTVALPFSIGANNADSKDRGNLVAARSLKTNR